MVTTQPTLREFDDFQGMFSAAAEAAGTSFGRPVSGIFYEQGGRHFISTGLPVRILLSLARRDSAKMKGDPTGARNRPLDAGHVREIAQYLSDEDKYLVPPIILNAAQPLRIFAYRASSATKPCVFVLPDGEYLYVTDGQHRLEALRQAAEVRPSIWDDSVGVTIVEESNMDKVHQDFFDAAQVKPLAKALLVEYDGREPVNAMAKEVVNGATIFHGRIERIGSVGKNSLMLFTNNQVKQGVLQLVVGDWSLYGDAMQKQADEALAPAADLWRGKILAFFEEFTRANTQWSEVAQRPLESGMTTDIPGLREKVPPLHRRRAAGTLRGGPCDSHPRPPTGRLAVQRAGGAHPRPGGPGLVLAMPRCGRATSLGHLAKSRRTSPMWCWPLPLRKPSWGCS